MASLIAVANGSSNYRKRLESSSREQFPEQPTANNTNNESDSQNEEPHVHVFSEFPELLISKLNDQRRCSSMCDVTIITNDGRSFRAHKAVLAATSRYLESELTALNNKKLNSKAEAVINLGMISSRSFETLLDLVYTAKLTLTKQNVADVLLAAEVLDLKRVGTICREFLRSQITSKSVACRTVCSESSESFLYDMNNNELRENMHEKFHDSSDNVSENLMVQADPVHQEEPISPNQSFVRESVQNRPSSLSEPTRSTESGYESRSASAPIQPRSPPLTNDSGPILNERNFPDNAPELIDVTSLNSSEKKSVNTDEFRRTKFLSCEEDCLPYYKVKSEVKTVPEYFPQYRYVSASASTEKFSSSLGNGNTTLPTSQNSRSFIERTRNDSGEILNGFESFSKRVCKPPIYETPSIPSQNRRSFDSTVGSYTNFVDLNAIPARKKARSNDSSIFQSAPLGQMETDIHGRYASAPSFLASLYMLRSQAYNPMSLLNANYNVNHPMPHAKRQLQHSKSIVSSSGLLCKFCRFEFTSEWALSMHYHLCHPANYFSPSQPTSPTNQSLPEKKNSDEQPKVLNALANPSLLTRSTSSPADVGQSNNLAETIESTDKMNINDREKCLHKCYHCKKEFSSIYLLRKHKSTEHLKRPFRCHRCESAFPNKAGLSVHLRSHTGERPYRCNVCDKAFTQLGHVQRHQKVHTGEKPYECPYCHARVRDKASMNYHILAHQGVKPFQCDQCDARFTKRSSLVKHKNVHTGSFLYQCPQCKASFREKASLSRHVRSQHKEPYFSVSSEFVATNTLVENNKSIDLSIASQKAPLDMCMEQSTDEMITVV